jgi:C-terminal processing protease CtpA/Prc
MQAKGLVIDVRNNCGGSSTVGYDILSYLTSRPIPVNRSVERREGASVRLRENAFALQSQEGSTGKPHVRARERVFNGAVAVLMGARTVSAAEDFVASFQALGRGKLIGQTTAGSTGQPLQFALPGGGVARVTSKHDMLPNGNEFVGKGIVPDIAVPRSLEEVRGQRDAALEVAVEQLSRPVTQIH